MEAQEPGYRQDSGLVTFSVGVPLMSQGAENPGAHEVLGGRDLRHPRYTWDLSVVAHLNASKLWTRRPLLAGSYVTSQETFL